MTASNAGSVTGQANIFHPVVSKNDMTAQEEEADPAGINDITQGNEEDDDYLSKSDLESDDEETPQKPQISERRRTQNKMFMSWFVLDISDAFGPF